METIITRIIEFGIVVILMGSIYLWDRIDFLISYNRQEKEWLETSFEFNGGRYNKKFFHVVDGKLCQWNIPL